MNISVEIFNPNKTFKRIFSDDVRKYANTRLHAYCSQYVPGGSGGQLNVNIDVTKDFVHYKSPYAHYQWEGELYLFVASVFEISEGKLKNRINSGRLKKLTNHKMCD